MILWGKIWGLCNNKLHTDFQAPRSVLLTWQTQARHSFFFHKPLIHTSSAPTSTGLALTHVAEGV